MHIPKGSVSINCFIKVILGLLLVNCSFPLLWAQSQTQGQWQTLPYLMPINPVHVALMHDGKVLVIAGSGNNSGKLGSGNLKAAVWDPQAGAFAVQQLNWDMFCNAMTVLPDGRVLIAGGTIAYSPSLGEKRSAVFDSVTRQFADLQPMAHGRWYPTTKLLPDGRVMVFGGGDENNKGNNAVEFYTVGQGWSQEFRAQWTPPLYPRLAVLPDGTLFYSGPTAGSRKFDPSTNIWTDLIATTNYAAPRTYGSSVLLPLTATNNYKPQVMLLGGGDLVTSVTATTETIDLSASSPSWLSTASMSKARIEMNAVLLPNGKILAVGGSQVNEKADGGGNTAELYDPATDTFSPAGTEAFPHLYHSNALLLPDATVLSVGGNPFSDLYEPHMEIYSPAYLFDSTGAPAVRPSITSAPVKVGYSATFTVQTPDAANISSVVIARPGSDTHAFDFDQRLINLTFTPAVAGSLTVTSPPNSKVAPPGYYMLFVLNNAGTPSVAKFIQVLANSTDAPPQGVITSPAADQTINAGRSITFAGNATDSDGTVASTQWIFPGGTPSQSDGLNPGGVTFSNPGTYVVSLTAVDDVGLNDPSPPTRTITVLPPPGFTLSFAPASGSESNQGIKAGSAYKGTLIVTPHNGYTGTVNLSCSKSPCVINPSSVTVVDKSTVSAALAINSTTNDVGIFKALVNGVDSADSTLNSNITISYLVMNYALAASSTSAIAGVAANLNLILTPEGDHDDVYSGTVSVQCNSSTLGPNSTCGFNPQSPVGIGPNPATVAATITIPAGTAAGNYSVQFNTFDTAFPTLAHTAAAVISVADFTLSATPGTFQVAAGQTASVSISAQNLAGSPFPGTVSFSCSGLPAQSSCSFSPASVTPGANSTTTLSIVTTGKSALLPPALLPPMMGKERFPLYALWLPGMIFGLVGIGTSIRRKVAGLFLLLTTLAILVLAIGCSGIAKSSSTTTSPVSSSGTPAGTYTVVVTGASGQIQRSTNVVLTVH